MKKLFIKDKILRNILEQSNKKYFILKSIMKNVNLFILIRQKAFLKLKKCSQKFSKVSIVNRCVNSFNKKRFNKFTLFSRFLYLKLIRNGKINGFQKSSW
jgi:ribosomal protein S14|uniref:Ribosomal protein S14 n=1 Tax=Entomoneis sp. TaxID=186043 RepID=A0A3G1PWC1_9STRA|nr:ribosomal protein S14 [Entomoneis sp.]